MSSKNPKKGPFDLSVDLCKIPSYRTRFSSMDSLTGGPINIEFDPVDKSQATDAEKNLRAKLGSHTDIRSTPSIILRRKGIRV